MDWKHQDVKIIQDLQRDVAKTVNWLARKCLSQRRDLQGVATKTVVDVYISYRHRDYDALVKIANRAVRNNGLRHLVENVQVVSIPFTSYATGTVSPYDVEAVPYFDVSHNASYDGDIEYKKLVDDVLATCQNDRERRIVQMRFEGYHHTAIRMEVGLSLAGFYKVLEGIKRRYKCLDYC